MRHWCNSQSVRFNHLALADADVRGARPSDHHGPAIHPLTDGLNVQKHECWLSSAKKRQAPGFQAAFDNGGIQPGARWARWLCNNAVATCASCPASAAAICRLTCSCACGRPTPSPMVRFVFHFDASQLPPREGGAVRSQPRAEASTSPVQFGCSPCGRIGRRIGGGGGLVPGGASIEGSQPETAHDVACMTDFNQLPQKWFVYVDSYKRRKYVWLLLKRFWLGDNYAGGGGCDSSSSSCCSSCAIMKRRLGSVVIRQC